MSNRYEVPSNGFGMNSRDLRELARSVRLLESKLKGDQRKVFPHFIQELSIEVIAHREGFTETYVRKLRRQIKAEADSLGIRFFLGDT